MVRALVSLSYTQCAFRAKKVVDMEVEAEFVYADILRTLQSSILGHDTTVRPGRAGGRRWREAIPRTSCVCMEV